MSEIEFKDPPDDRGGRTGKWLRLLSPLVDHPGRWAVVLRTDTPTKAYAHRGQLERRNYRVPTGQWSFAARKNGVGGEVFARYDGPDE